MYGEDLSASELISSPPLSVCATPHCATSFSHSPLLCLISRSLSSRAPACPRDSDPLNIHSLSSIAPLVLLEEWGEKKGKKRMTLNYSGLNQGYFWRLPRLRWDGAVGSSVCVFWCGGSVNSMSILRCHNCRHYTIMQGSSDAHFTPDDNFLSLPHGCRTSIDQLNRYMMLCKEICSILHTDKQCERPDVGKKRRLKPSFRSVQPLWVQAFDQNKAGLIMQGAEHEAFSKRLGENCLKIYSIGWVAK